MWHSLPCRVEVPAGSHLHFSLKASQSFQEAEHFISKILKTQELIKIDEVTLLNPTDIIRKEAGMLIRAALKRHKLEALWDSPASRALRKPGESWEPGTQSLVPFPSAGGHFLSSLATPPTFLSPSNMPPIHIIHTKA